MKNRFAETIAPGVVSTIIGVMGLAFAVGKPLISFLMGLLGILIGFLSLRLPAQEKLDKWSTWFGMFLSVSSMIWSLFNIYGQ